MMSAVSSRKRLFVSNLSNRTSKKDVEDFFTQWGTLSECILPAEREFVDRCRGFAFISFLWDQDASACLESQPHTICGSTVSIRILDEEVPSQLITSISSKKIMVSFTSRVLSMERIRDYFDTFGCVKEIIICVQEGYHRYAIVTFEDPDSCQSCVRIGYHYIDEVLVRVRKVIRTEELKRAKQIERERKDREARIRSDREAALSQRTDDPNGIASSSTEPKILVPPRKLSPKEVICGKSSWVPLNSVASYSVPHSVLNAFVPNPPSYSAQPPSYTPSTLGGMYASVADFSCSASSLAGYGPLNVAGPPSQYAFDKGIRENSANTLVKSDVFTPDCCSSTIEQTPVTQYSFPAYYYPPR
ncbi:hypothetical protein AB6A40_000985 [Gnathostoma spinigerum]|uniref:RRM domain-containing protein n=1 Tax=Gnathostoma spinigerum TaxID=75299 RepID=A0ABD6EA32_9BILA